MTNPALSTPVKTTARPSKSISSSPTSAMLPHDWASTNTTGDEFLRCLLDRANSLEEPVPAAPKPTVECDYDQNPTELYQAIEAKQWTHALSLLNSATKNITAQAKTWVIRRETNGKLRWRMLPLHAAIIFKAPFDVIEALLVVSPHAAYCKDDQGKLPLHLAFRLDASDDIIDELVTAFPMSIEVKDRKGRKPLQCAGAPGKHSPRRLMETYLSLAIASERNKITRAAKEEHDKMVQALKVEHEAALKHCKEQVIALDSEVKAARISCNAMISRVSHASDNESSLMEQILQIKREKSKYEEAIGKLEDCVNDRETKLQEKEEEQNTVFKDLEHKNETITSLERSLNMINEKLRAKEDEHSAATLNLVEKQNVIATLEEKLSKIDEMLQGKDGENNLVKEQLESVTVDRDFWREKAGVFERSSVEWKERADGYHGAMNVLSGMKADLEQERDALKKKLEKQGDSMIATSAKMDELLARVDNHEQDLKAIWAVRDRMMQNVLKQDEEMQTLTNKERSSMREIANGIKKDMVKASSSSMPSVSASVPAPISTVPIPGPTNSLDETCISIASTSSENPQSEVN